MFRTEFQGTETLNGQREGERLEVTEAAFREVGKMLRGKWEKILMTSTRGFKQIIGSLWCVAERLRKRGNDQQVCEMEKQDIWRPMSLVRFCRPVAVC